MTSTQTPPKVVFDGAGKTFEGEGKLGEVVAVERADLILNTTEFVCILGPSGCGKSTLLNMVAGLDPPSSGSVFFQGNKVLSVNTQVGYMPQDSKLFPWLTAAKNIEFPLQVRDFSLSERMRLVGEYLRKVGLEGFADAYPRQLSGGMQKRASLARTLVYKPQLLLMDEPFSALDAQTKMVMQDELLRLWEEERSTVIFVTHDIVEAIALGDRVVVMTRRPGKIAEDVPVTLSRPRDVFAIHEQEGFDEIYDHVLSLVKREMSYE